MAGRKVFTYTGEPVTGIPDGTAPNVLNTSYTITADIDVPQGGGEGMIVTEGGRFGGYGHVPAEGQAGLPVEPAGPEAGDVGRRPGASPASTS